MDVFDADFCFYDDAEVTPGGDADSLSTRLWLSHQRLWSKQLPSGDRLVLTAGLKLSAPASVEGMRLGSDTIATTHSTYPGMPALWQAIPKLDRKRYERGFYTIGGFLVFPKHTQSLNQVRGFSRQICDRFDLTLECIRLYYEGITTLDRNPLGTVLLTDGAFFDLFGRGAEGFRSYSAFFHLDHMVVDGAIRWFDGSPIPEWDFSTPPLPSTESGYREYLENVLHFVQARNAALAAAEAAREPSAR